MNNESQILVEETKTVSVISSGTYGYATAAEIIKFAKQVEVAIEHYGLSPNARLVHGELDGRLRVRSNRVMKTTEVPRS